MGRCARGWGSRARCRASRTRRRSSSSAPTSRGDATVLAILAGLRSQIEAGYADLVEMEARVERLPHRARYLRLLNELARRTYDMQRDWLDHVEAELSQPPA